MKVHFEGSPAEIADLVRLLAGTASAGLPAEDLPPAAGVTWEPLPGLDLDRTDAERRAAERRAFSQAPEAFGFTGDGLPPYQGHHVGVTPSIYAAPRPPPAALPTVAQTLRPPAPPEPEPDAALLDAGREAWSLLWLFWWGRFRQPRAEGMTELERVKWDHGLQDALSTAMQDSGAALMAVAKAEGGLTRSAFRALGPVFTLMDVPLEDQRRWARIVAEHFAQVATASHMAHLARTLEQPPDMPDWQLWASFSGSPTTTDAERERQDAVLRDWETWAFCVPLARHDMREALTLWTTYNEAKGPEYLHDLERRLSDALRPAAGAARPDPTTPIQPYKPIDVPKSYARPGDGPLVTHDEQERARFGGGLGSV